MSGDVAERLMEREPGASRECRPRARALGVAGALTCWLLAAGSGGSGPGIRPTVIVVAGAGSGDTTAVRFAVNRMRSALRESGRFTLIEKEQSGALQARIAQSRRLDFDSSLALSYDKSLEAVYVCVVSASTSLDHSRVDKSESWSAAATVSAELRRLADGACLIAPSGREFMTGETRQWAEIHLDWCIERVVAQLARAISQALPLSGLLVLSGKELYINLGSLHGVKAGQRYRVERVSGEPVGEVQVELVGNQSSRVRTRSGHGWQSGDRVVLTR